MDRSILVLEKVENEEKNKKKVAKSGKKIGKSEENGQKIVVI